MAGLIQLTWVTVAIIEIVLCLKIRANFMRNQRYGFEQSTIRFQVISIAQNLIRSA